MKTTNLNFNKHKSISETLLLIVVLLFSCTLNAQSWQWLKAGGNDVSGSGYDFTETINFMGSDSQGNVYVAFKQAFYPMNNDQHLLL